MYIHRRGLLIGLASLIAAPAIVRASSLMPIKVFNADVVALDLEGGQYTFQAYWSVANEIHREVINPSVNVAAIDNGDLVTFKIREGGKLLGVQMSYAA